MTSFARLLGCSLVLAAFTAPAYAQRAPALVQGAAPKFLQADHVPDVLRERGVTLNLANLAKAAGDTQRVVEIAFFEDATFNIAIKRTEATQSGGIGYGGVVLGSNEQHPAVIVDNAGAIAANVIVGGRRFVLQGSAHTGYVAREIALITLPDHPTEKIDLTGRQYMAHSFNLSKTGPVPVPPPVAGADSSNVIDVMVVYTPAARTAAGGVAQINAIIDAEVIATNVVYAQSGVVQQLRLVHKSEVPYVETGGGNGFNIALNQITSPNDGVMDDVATMRNAFKADFVSLWINNNASCGLGWIMSTESLSFESLGYNVQHFGCAGGVNYTFAHELGHNMGLNHDVFPDPDTTTRVTPSTGGGLTVIEYSRGYVDTFNRFRTIMAYPDACSALGFNCRRLPNFSNVDMTIDNRSFFAGAAASAPMGLLLAADERRALNDTRETTQNLRQPALTTLAGPGIVMLLPTTYTVNENVGNAVLTVQRLNGSTGAISVAYATSNGTASSGADYTTTNGTLNWANGDAANKTILVPILQDTALEGYENFTVTLSTPTGGASIATEGGTTQAGTVRIADDEADTFPVSNLLPGGFTSPNNPNANTANSQWTVDTLDGFMSGMSLRSAQMLSPQQPTPEIPCCTQTGFSDLEYTGVFRAGNVGFLYKLSSYQSGFSGFEFFIDGVSVFANNVGGEVNWTQVTQAITAGTHTLRWRFKNSLTFACTNVNPPAVGGVNCMGRAWIDGLVMPLALDSQEFATSDVSGDGRSDLVFQNANGQIAAWTMNGTAATATANLIGAGQGWSVTHTADLSGDGKKDILLRHTDGRVYLYVMNGLTVAAGRELLGAGQGWSVSHAADVSGDGKADLVLRNTDGRKHLWLMDGVNIIGSSSLQPAASPWTVIHTGDFNGDGKADLVWQHTDGRGYIYLMNGITVMGGAEILAPATGWIVSHVADLSADGKSDLVFRHTDGRAHVFLMNGTTFGAGGALLGAASGWTVTHVGDFNGDGRADVVFRNADGRAHVRLMNGVATIAGTDVLQAASGFTITHILDLNGDGRKDIVFRHTDGRIVLRTMNGLTTLANTNAVGAGGWSVAPPQ